MKLSHFQCFVYFRTAIVWDLSLHRSLHVLQHPDSVLSIKIKSNLLVTGCGDGIIRLFNISTGKCLGELKGEEPGLLDSIISDAAFKISGVFYGL